MTTAQRRRWRISRDSIIFGIGILGIIYETLVAGGDRPTLLVLFSAMIGLPAFLHQDERLKSPPPVASAPPPDPPVTSEAP